MDSGYLGPGENHAQALDDDYDVTRELSPEEVLGIMDGLLCHEVGRDVHTRILDAASDRANLSVAIDGMAYGPSSFPNPLHIPVP